MFVRQTARLRQAAAGEEWLNITVLHSAFGK
jgi:hypothetical protein